MALKFILYRSVIFIGLLFLGNDLVQAQTVTTDIDKKEILIGEQIKYEIKINLPASAYKIDIDIPDSIAHFDIVEQKKYDTIDKNGLYTLRQDIVFTSFDSGVWKIPSFPVSISLPNKPAQYFFSDSLLVKVGYAVADTSVELRDIKPIMEVFVLDRKWLNMTLAFIGILLLVFFLFRYFKHRKKKPKPVFDTSVSAYEEAIKALEKLQQQPVSDSDSLKTYYSDLSNIFKKYYSRKTDHNRTSDTTGDLLISLKTHINSAEALSFAAQALRCADAVKFAKYIPPASENTASVSLIKQVIDQLEKRSTF